MHTVYDTETSGFKERRLLELGMILVDENDNFRPCMQMSVIVKPDGWRVEQGATDVHGITQEYAEFVGLPLEMALSLFTKFRQLSSMMVCHNLTHDHGVMDKELQRMQWPSLGAGGTPFFCTMRGMENVCKIVRVDGRRGFKLPTLAEAYRHVTGKEIERAHTALGDAEPTAAVFEWMVRQGHVRLPGIVAVPVAPLPAPPIVQIQYVPVCTVLPKCSSPAECYAANHCRVRAAQSLPPPPPAPPKPPKPAPFVPGAHNRL